MDDVEHQQQNSPDDRDLSRVPAHLQPHVFKKGQSGNPKGRPAGKSLKEYAKEMLGSMSDEERQEFLNGIPKEKIWEMAEGKPEAKTDLTSKGERLVILPAAVVDSFNLDAGTDTETRGVDTE